MRILFQASTPWQPFLSLLPHESGTCSTEKDASTPFSGLRSLNQARKVPMAKQGNGAAPRAPTDNQEEYATHPPDTSICMAMVPSPPEIPSQCHHTCTKALLLTARYLVRSASASNHSAFLVDLSRVDIECKTTRSGVTLNELFGRDGIDLCHTSPWNHDDCLTGFDKGLSSSDTIDVEAGSFRYTP